MTDENDKLRAENERLRKAAGVVSAVLRSERNRLGGQPFTGNWSIPQIGFRGTVDDALDMADAALTQKGDQPCPLTFTPSPARPADGPASASPATPCGAPTAAVWPRFNGENDGRYG